MKRFICYSIIILIACTISSNKLFAGPLKDTLNPVDWNPYDESKPVVNDQIGYVPSNDWTKSLGFPRNRISLDIAPFMSRGNPGIYIGLDYELFLSRYISLDYNISLGSSMHNNLYLNVNSGIIGSGYCIMGIADDDDENSDDRDVRAGAVSLAILSAIIPEGIGVHIPLNKNSNLNFHIAPLAYQFIGGYEGMAFSFSAKVTYQLTRLLSVSPYAKISTLYSGESAAISLMGIQLGFSF